MKPAGSGTFYFGCFLMSRTHLIGAELGHIARHAVPPTFGRTKTFARSVAPACDDVSRGEQGMAALPDQEV